MLVGLNFYGYSYSAKKHADALLGSDYVAMLKKHNPRIAYNEEVHEHVFKVKDGAWPRCIVCCGTATVLIQMVRRRRCGFPRCSRCQHALSWPSALGRG